MKVGSLSLWALGLGVAVFAGQANAADILCKTLVNEHMLVSDTYVTSCLDAGVGNINGNDGQDPFLLGYGSYDLLSKSDGTNTYNITYTQAEGAGGSGSSGAFQFDASIWDNYDTVAIGFKFGTGNEPDEWFVYSLVNGVSSGLWQFVENTPRGGSGLSHMNLYGFCTNPDGCETDLITVPEPATLALLGLAVAGIGFTVRRRSL